LVAHFCWSSAFRHITICPTNLSCEHTSLPTHHLLHQASSKQAGKELVEQGNTE
jgi:hypothetical protein